MLKNMLLQIHSKHIEETNILREEMNKLNDKVEKLEQELEIQSTNNKSNDEIKQTEQKTVNKKDTVNVENAENWYTCNMCDYRVKKEITLKKHINSKHSKMTYLRDWLQMKWLFLSFVMNVNMHATERNH